MVLAGIRVERETGGLSSAGMLVGRDRELEMLVQTTARAPAVVLIEGEAGIGKSRLVSEFCLAAEPRRVPVLLGHCHPQRDPFPLQPIVEALSGARDQLRHRTLNPIVGALRPLLPELADLLPPAPELAADSHAEGHQIFRGLREMLDAMGQTVLVLEDLHWADETTIDLLSFLVVALPPRLRLILTYRPQDLDEASPLRGLAARVGPGVATALVSLAPLDAAGVSSLIADILEVDAVTDEFADLLHQRTAGIPYAVEEMLRLLQDRRDLVRQDGRWTRRELDRIEVPGALRDAILERRARLSPEARRLVAAAAVLGLPSSETELSAVADVNEDELPTALSEVLQSGLLAETPAGLAAFRHDLARQAVYEAIEGPHRRRLHLRAARLLEAERSCPAARVAHHYREAGKLEEWAQQAERAANQAVAVFEGSDSCHILLDLQSTPSLPVETRIRLAAKLGHEPHAGLSKTGAVEIVRGILEEESSAETRGELQMLLGHALIDAGDWSAGCEQLAQSIPELAGSPGLAGRALMTLADPRLPHGSMVEHLAWLDRSMEIGAAAPDALARMESLLNRASVLMLLGDPRARDAVAEITRRANSMGEKRAEAAGLAAIAVGASYLGYYGLARDLITEATGIVDQFDCGHVIAGHQAVWLMLDWFTGNWEGLEERAGSLTAELPSNPDRPSPELMALNLVRLAQQGPAAALAGLEAAMQRAARAGSAPGFALASGAVARCRVEAGEPDEALEAALPAIDLLRRKGIWVWTTHLAPAAVEALCLGGRIDEARSLVKEVAAGLKGRDAPAPAAELLLCRGLVEEAAGAGGRAVVHYLAAAEAFAALPRPHAAALARERAGRVLLDTDQVRAIEILSSAVDGLERLGATRESARVRQLLRRRGVVSATARPSRSRSGGFLSPREFEIVQLAAAGKTSPQIAELLFLSERTVENHLGRAMHKHGVKTRAALVAAVEKVAAPIN